MNDNSSGEPVLFISGRPYRQFIHAPEAVRDGTCRCISCGQIDEEGYHLAEFCPGMGGQLPRTANVDAFLAANAESPVVSGAGFKRGGGRYTLADRRTFKFTLHEIRSMPMPRWDLGERVA